MNPAKFNQTKEEITLFVNMEERQTLATMGSVGSLTGFLSSLPDWQRHEITDHLKSREPMTLWINGCFVQVIDDFITEPRELIENKKVKEVIPF